MKTKCAEASFWVRPSPGSGCRGHPHATRRSPSFCSKMRGVGLALCLEWAETTAVTLTTSSAHVWPLVNERNLMSTATVLAGILTRYDSLHCRSIHSASHAFSFRSIATRARGSRRTRGAGQVHSGLWWPGLGTFSSSLRWQCDSVLSACDARRANGRAEFEKSFKTVFQQIPAAKRPPHIWTFNQRNWKYSSSETWRLRPSILTIERDTSTDEQSCWTKRRKVGRSFIRTHQRYPH